MSGAPSTDKTARKPASRKLVEPKLVIATHNPGKLREIQELMAPHGLEVVSAGALGLPEPEETGTTFIANAELKALAAAKASGMPALADDSGFSLAALNGEPGIYSARWAGESKDFGAAMELVHQRILESGSTDTRAWFTCALSLAWPDGHTETVEGVLQGHYAWPPRGENGFGYDPMFVPEGHDKTFGEVDAAWKHSVSHRALAYDQLVARCLPDPTDGNA